MNAGPLSFYWFSLRADMQEEIDVAEKQLALQQIQIREAFIKKNHFLIDIRQ